MKLEFGPDDDDRATGVIDALAQQVLAEAALFSLEHVAKRLEGTLVGAGDNASAAAIVKKRVHCLLQHTHFVADDDVGRAQFHQAL